jgi:hypothetical protein
VRCLLDPEPSIKPNVPWDPAELQGRDCEHCACYFESVNPENPTQYQGFCRRWPAEFSQTRGQVPRLDPVTKLPMMKNGVPVMNNELITGFLFKPTQRQGVCFDGWRQKGTLPGARSLTPAEAETIAQFLEQLKQAR